VFTGVSVRANARTDQGDAGRDRAHGATTVMEWRRPRHAEALTPVMRFPAPIATGDGDRPSHTPRPQAVGAAIWCEAAEPSVRLGMEPSACLRFAEHLADLDTAGDERVVRCFDVGDGQIEAPGRPGQFAPRATTRTRAWRPSTPRVSAAEPSAERFALNCQASRRRPPIRGPSSVPSPAPHGGRPRSQGYRPGVPPDATRRRRRDHQPAAMNHLPRNDIPARVTRDYLLPLDKTGRRLPGLSTTRGWWSSTVVRTRFPGPRESGQHGAARLCAGLTTGTAAGPRHRRPSRFKERHVESLQRRQH
jgi:hypothetical protein